MCWWKKKYSSSQSGKGKVTISTYTAGSVFQNPAYQTLNQYLEASKVYTGTNAEAMNAVRQRARAEVAAAIRKGEGQAEIIDGIVMIGGVVIGVTAIVASGGMATPAVAAVTAGGGATVTMYGASNVYEGIDLYRLGLAGDVNSAAFNPIRDTIFQGNQTVYDIWGTIGHAMFASGSMANSYMMAGKTKITEVKGLRERAKWSNEVGVANKIKYSPIKPGPLSDDVAKNFNAATYTEKVLQKDTALPQNILDSLGNTIGTLQGGGNQIYIPKVEAGWFK